MGEVVKGRLISNNVAIGSSIGGSLAQRAYSPTVELTETEDGVRIEMTDVNGTQEATVYNGQDYVLTEEDREEIADIAKESMDYDDVPTDGSNNLLTSGTVKEALDLKADKTELPVNVSELNNDAGYLTQHQDISGKQDKLTFDNTPKAFSSNPVTSAGVYDTVRDISNDVSTLQSEMVTAKFDIGLKVNKNDVEAELSSYSVNPVQNKTIKAALDLKADKTEVPEKVSDLTNDAGYLTQHQDISGKQDKLTFDNVPKAYSDNPVKSGGVYNAMHIMEGDISSLENDMVTVRFEIGTKANKTELPTKVSDLTNDAGYLTQHQDISGKQDALTFDSTPTANSTNPVTSGGVYDAIANVNTMDVHICTSEEYNAQTGVPTVSSPDVKTFYLVPGGEANNLYIEWVYVNGAWEQFGSATVDLSGYALKSELPQNVSDLVNDAGYLTSHQDISGKQDALTFDDAPTDGSNNPVKSGGINIAISALRSDMQYFDNQNSRAIESMQMNMNFSLSQKQDVLTFDNAPTANSSNPVKSSGVKSAIDAVAGNIPGIIVNSTTQEKAAIRTAIGAENGDDIVKVQDAQPSGSATKIWIPETMPEGVEVPTVDEVEDMIENAIQENIGDISAITADVATIQAAASDAEAYTQGTRNGTSVGSSDPAYHNNAKYYSEMAFAGTPDGYDALATDVSDIKRDFVRISNQAIDELFES